MDTTRRYLGFSHALLDRAAASGSCDAICICTASLKPETSRLPVVLFPSLTQLPEPTLRWTYPEECAITNGPGSCLLLV